jgi:radical SAM superfamily enzyme YgiQ (UPF0313 family)
MRVLLISENRCRDNLVPWPIGAACVATAARAAGHQVAGLDLMFSADAAADVESAIREFAPDCVGLSVRNIDNQEMKDNRFFMPAVREIVGVVRSSTAAPLVLGGAGFTIFPLECLRYTGAGMGIVGEGEDSFTLLLGRLATGAGIDDVPGLALAAGGRETLNPPPPHVDFRETGAPDRSVFDVSPYDWVPGHGPPFLANIQARRGCHMRCIYCTNPLIEGREVRCRDAADVAAELESLQKDRGIRTVLFTDSNFLHPPDYARELCARIVERGLTIKWLATINPMVYQPDLFGLMKEAGCITVSLGNESGSDRMLEALKKDFTASDVRKNAAAAREQGLTVNCFLMLGGPGETRRSVEESVALMDELRPDAVWVTVGVRIFPGCELEQIAVADGFISRGQDLLRPAFYLAREVAPWLYQTMAEVCASRPTWSL